MSHVFGYRRPCGIPDASCPQPTSDGAAWRNREASATVARLDASALPFEMQHPNVGLTEGGVEAEVHRNVIGRAERGQSELDQVKRSLSVAAVVDVLDRMMGRKTSHCLTLICMHLISWHIESNYEYY